MSNENEISIPIELARVICEMEGVCYSEGVGPDSDKLMAWIAKNYPALKDEFSYLPWASYR